MPIYEDTRAVLAMLKDVQQSVIENDDLSNNPQVLKTMIIKVCDRCHKYNNQAVIKYFSYFERGTEAKILLQEFVFHDGSYPPLKMRFSPENIHYFLEITYFPKELKQNYQKIHHPSKAYCEIHI